MTHYLVQLKQSKTEIMLFGPARECFDIATYFGTLSEYCHYQVKNLCLTQS